MYQDHQKTKRMVLRAESKYRTDSLKQQEMVTKFAEMMLRKHKRVEKRFAGSVVNQMYIFPRGSSPEQSEESEVEEEVRWERYDLASQNKKDTSHQFCSQTVLRSSSALQMLSAARNSSNKKRPFIPSQRSRKDVKDESLSCRVESQKQQQNHFKANRSKKRAEHKNSHSYSSRREDNSNYNSRKGDKSYYQSRKRKED